MITKIILKKKPVTQRFLANNVRSYPAAALNTVGVVIKADMNS